MEEELGYDELYAKYAELQLRVTRFSSTEQEIRLDFFNTRYVVFDFEQA